VLGQSLGSDSSVAAARQLEMDLRGCQSGEVRFDDGSRAAYSTDASSYRQMPIGVVVPRTTEDVVRAVEACRAASTLFRDRIDRLKS
jgi:FAD/FMN-containing dehydrogenase